MQNFIKRNDPASEIFESLFQSGGIGLTTVSLDQRILDTNQTFCEMTGYSRDELLGMSVSDLTHPDDLEMTSTFFLKAREENIIHSFEKRYLSKEGDVIWCKMRSVGIKNENDETQGRVVMVEDITKEKNNEIILEQMASIVEESDDAIFRTDKNHKIQFWGKGAEKLYGYSSEEVIGSHASFINSDNNNKEIHNVQENLLQGSVIHDPCLVTKHKDGHLIEVSSILFPIKNKTGETIAHAAVHRDITQIKHLEDQLRHSQRMETAGMLAGGIAHDFNNILTVIQGSCNFISQDIPEDSQIARHIGLIERSADRASRLTRQLLTFSRKQRSSPEVIEPNGMLNDFASMLTRTLGDDIILDTQLNSTWNIKIDPTQFEQIILNLSVNARHAMSNGGKISIETSDIYIKDDYPAHAQNKLQNSPKPITPGNYILITVTDTGSGMDKDVLEYIFDPFFTTKQKEEGTGLGLSVVYGMVAQSGGSINVTTELGVGTEFQVYLPKTEETLDPARAKSQSAALSGKGKILIIEDDEDVRTLTVAILEKAGYNITVAENPTMVLSGEIDGIVDLILTDINMPEMSGPEFSEIWLDKHPHSKILFMSGFFDEDNFTEIVTSTNLISKPFKPDDLLKRVIQSLES